MSPRGRRDQVGFLRDRGVSQRRACGLLGVPRSTLSYRLRLPEKDGPALAAMQRLSAQYPRYGYRRIRILLRISPRRYLDTIRLIFPAIKTICHLGLW